MKSAKGGQFERDICRQLSEWWSDGKRDDLRPSAPRDAIEIANEFREEVVRVEFPDDQLQECASPLKLRCA